MAAREHDIVADDHLTALIVAPTPTFVGAGMIAALFGSRTWLDAIDRVMHAIRVTLLDASMATEQLFVTHEIATSFR